MTLDYKKSGVDIDKGEKFVEIIKEKLGETARLIGGFGGVFDLAGYNYDHPVLVAGTDGVGTKMLLARKANKYDTIGIDLVAMCVNDVVSMGAKPLFFLDYMSTDRLDLDSASSIMDGIISGCREAECVLLGGETAELPGMYSKGTYELAGFCVGIADKKSIIDGSAICAGDLLVGVPSSGIHSNGLSLARKALFEVGGYGYYENLRGLDKPLILELLEPTRIYVSTVLALLKSLNVHGIAHITGGGIYLNVKRLLPRGLEVKIDWESVKPHKIFDIIQSAGEIDVGEMRRVFNMGIGMVFIVSESDADKTLEVLKSIGEEPVIIGRVIKEIM